MSKNARYNEEAFENARPQDEAEQSNRIVFWVFFGLSCLFALFFWRAGYSWIGLIIVGVVLATAMFIAPQVAFYVYFAWQSFDAVFLPSAEAIFTPAKAFAFFIILVYIVSLGKIRHRILISKTLIILLLLFGCVGLLGTPFAVNRFIALKDSLQVFVQLLLVVGALHFLDSKKRVNFAFLCCFFGGLIVAVLMMVTSGLGVYWERPTLGQFANPVTTALALSVSMISIVGLWVYKKSKIYYVLYITGGLMMLLQIMRTGTRAALVSILFGLILGPVFARGTGILKRTLIPLAVSVFIVGAVLYILSLNVLPEQSQERISVSYTIEGQIKGKGELSRPVIWKNALATYLRYRPVTGFGFGNSVYAMVRYHGYRRDIHSSILAPLVDSGPVGFILFIGTLIFIFLKVRKIENPRIGIAAMTIYMFIIFSLLTHTIHFTKYFWIPLTLCLLLVEQNTREEMETDYQEYLGE